MSVNPQEAYDAVADTSMAIARCVDGSARGIGRVIAYSIQPQVLIDCGDGTTFWWRVNMVELAPADTEADQ